MLKRKSIIQTSLLVALALVGTTHVDRLNAQALSNQAEIEVLQDAQAQENWAYSLGIQAYVFTLPLTMFQREYTLRTNPQRIEQIRDRCPCGLINDTGHQFNLATADDVMPYTPNNDTVYTGIALDYSDEPIIVSLPDIYDRYWSAQVVNPYLENQFYIGTRATDGDGGHHAFIPPNWQGVLPDNVIEHRMEYSTSIIALRFSVDPEYLSDLQLANDLQRQAKITSLSNFQKALAGDGVDDESFGVAAMPSSLALVQPYDGELTYFQTVADLLAMYPPEAQHRAMVESFEQIGLVPGEKFDVENLDENIKRGLVRAIADAASIMQWKNKYRGTPYSTRWNNLQPGDYGLDYFDRAAGALEGLIVHSRDEAVYFSTYESGDGALLDGTKKYHLHFEKDEIPPTLENGFWSLTMYGTDFQLVQNSADRFSIGDRTPGLHVNDNGSIDIFIQSTPPEEGESNWLPSPPNGIFRVNYRVYLPTEETSSPETLSQFIPAISVVGE